MIQRKTGLKRKAGIKRSPPKHNKTQSLHAMYGKFDTETDPICTGCGCSIALSHSHIISRKDIKLMDDPLNLTYHCLPVDGANGCSEKWENVGYRTSLLDYIHNMQYIKSVRPLIFNKMIIDDYSYLQKHTQFLVLEANFAYICREFKAIQYEV